MNKKEIDKKEIKKIILKLMEVINESKDIIISLYGKEYDDITLKKDCILFFRIHKIFCIPFNRIEDIWIEKNGMTIYCEGNKKLTFAFFKREYINIEKRFFN